LRNEENERDDERHEKSRFLVRLNREEPKWYHEGSQKDCKVSRM
jgi:hypothetical protein